MHNLKTIDETSDCVSTIQANKQNIICTLNPLGVLLRPHPHSLSLKVALVTFPVNHSLPF